jgi:hypothetical protein
MSNKRKASGRELSTPKPVARRGISRARIIVPTLVIAFAVAFGWWSSIRTEKQSTPPIVHSDSSVQPAAVSAGKASFQAIQGKWLRPDGGYVLDIKSVDAGGKMDAAYLNPKSIHVSKSQATQDGSALKIFVELRDVNYPGSTYDLTYNPDDDQFKGLYYHAGLKQRLEVNFVRMK